MMSKATRKSLHNENPEAVIGSRRRESLIKASGDSPNDHQRTRTKTNIPKSIRNDLENTLVGLCDVWFEEIKPHLIRNKVKLHIHPAANHAGRGQGGEDCPHIDTGAAPTGTLRRRPPAASSVDCCSTQPPASTAPCHKLPCSPPLPPEMTRALVEAATQRYKKDVGVQTTDNGLIAASADNDSCPHNKVLMKIQEVYAAMSEVEESEPIRCQYKQKSLFPDFEPSCTRSSSSSALSPKDPIVPMNSDCSDRDQTPSPKYGVCDVRMTKKNPKNKRYAAKGHNTAISTNHTMQRRTATTTIPPCHQRCTNNSRQKKEGGKTSISPDNLIDKFGEKHGERVSVLYKSQKSEASSGIALLDSTSHKVPNKNTVAVKPKKKPPWR